MTAKKSGKNSTIIAVEMTKTNLNYELSITASSITIRKCNPQRNGTQHNDA
jgi:hypothetical protein